MSVLRERLYAAYLDGGAAAGSMASAAGGLERRRATLASLVARYFPTDRQARILDIGCGHGALLYFVHQAGYGLATGVDVSPQQVALAQRLGITGVRQGDLLDTLGKLEPRSLDVVVALDVIEHFTKDELVDLVDGVARVLKPGGRWIIQAPNGESPFCGAIRFGDLTHEQAFTRTSLDQLLRISGFAAVSTYETAPIAHGFKSAIRWMLWRIIRSGLRMWSMAETGDSGRNAVFTRNLLAVAIRGD